MKGRKLPAGFRIEKAISRRFRRGAALSWLYQGSNVSA
jgi:hypothetical protein